MPTRFLKHSQKRAAGIVTNYRGSGTRMTGGKLHQCQSVVEQLATPRVELRLERTQGSTTVAEVVERGKKEIAFAWQCQGMCWSCYRTYSDETNGRGRRLCRSVALGRLQALPAVLARTKGVLLQHAVCCPCYEVYWHGSCLSIMFLLVAVALSNPSGASLSTYSASAI